MSQSALAGIVFAMVTGLSFLTYGSSLSLPFVSDDYLQVLLGRQYGPIEKWGVLLHDALYRCRATSILLTYWIDSLGITEPIGYGLVSLAIHIANSMLVFALGSWRVIGWRISAIAACFFAVSQRHHEAVIWFAAVPELLVFFFAIASLLLWIRWLQDERPSAAVYWASYVLFVIALFSKESAVAVVPLMGIVAILAHSGLGTFVRLLPFALTSVVYFGMAWLARETHLHFNDGTFSLGAPFVQVLLRSSIRLVWFWGVVAIAALALWRAWRWRQLVILGGVWIVITLLPYSFLTYMPRVPSRHTYFATAGLALIVAAAFWEAQSRERMRRLLPLAALVLIAHQGLYIHFFKRPQFEERARPTEEVFRRVRASSKPLYVKCFPYDPIVARQVVQIRLPDQDPEKVIYSPQASPDLEAVDLCNELIHK